MVILRSWVTCMLAKSHTFQVSLMSLKRKGLGRGLWREKAVQAAQREGAKHFTLGLSG